MKRTLEVKYDEATDDHYIQFDAEMLAQVGWDFGDVLQWKDNLDGSFTLSKKMDDNSSDSTSDESSDGTSKTQSTGDAKDNI